MKAPILFGFPLYVNMKRRVANSYIKSWWRSRSLKSNYWNEWSKRIGNLKVGDLFRDCSGVNRRIVCIEPRYLGIGNGRVLIDIDITNELGGGCSLKHCGPDAPATKQEVEQYRDYLLARPDAKNWHWDISYSPEVMTINEDGTVSINYELEKRLLEERNEAIRLSRSS